MNVLTRALDTHCHLGYKQYDSDREDVVRRSLESGVDLLTVGTDYCSSKRSAELAQKYSGVWAAVGLHPEEIERKDWRSELALIAKLFSTPKVVAIGEVGFDLFRADKTNRKETLKRQERVFDFCAAEAVKMNKPLIVHNRETVSYFVSKLKHEKTSLFGVHHCFTGSKEQARSLLNLNFMLGFTGMVTFSNRFDEIIKFVPLASILIETDSPFLTPVPFRGRRNEPSYVLKVAKKIAEVKKLTLEKVVKATSQNSYKIFKLL